MPEISCFYIHYNLTPDYIIFIKFEKYFIIYLSEVLIITLSYDTFMKIPKLFDFYILSLVLTEDIHQLYKLYEKYTINTIHLWKRLYLCNKYKNVYIHRKNLLNKCEPTRQSSNKKIKKFIKNLNRVFYNDKPIAIMEIYINKIIDNAESEMKEGIKLNNKISLLTGIKKKYGEDIYDQIRNYL